MQSTPQREPIRDLSAAADPKHRPLRDAKAVKSAERDRNERRKLEPPIHWLRHAQSLAPGSRIKVVGVSDGAAPEIKATYGIGR